MDSASELQTQQQGGTPSLCSRMSVGSSGRTPEMEMTLWLGPDSLWRCLYSHGWWLMLAVGWDLGSVRLPEQPHVASPCGLELPHSPAVKIPKMSLPRGRMWSLSVLEALNLETGIMSPWSNFVCWDPKEPPRFGGRWGREHRQTLPLERKSDNVIM